MPLIVAEGSEGCGKTTFLREVQTWLNNQGHDTLLTKEPGSPHSPVTTCLRSLILDPPGKLSRLSELYLYLADRAQHVEDVLKPALEKGTYVLCDRYFFSTYVYQGFIQGISLSFIESLNQSFPAPDLTFVLDVEVETAMRRVQSRGGNLDRFDAGGIEFYTKLRKEYWSLAQNPRLSNRKAVILNANKSIQDVANVGIGHLLNWFPLLQSNKNA